MQNKDKFLQIIQADCAHIRNNLTPHKYLEHIFYVARKWTEWGNEYHLLVLSVGLQRDIYFHLLFRLAELTPNQRNESDALKALFDGHQLSNIYFKECCQKCDLIHKTLNLHYVFSLMESITTQQLNGIQSIAY